MAMVFDCIAFRAKRVINPLAAVAFVWGNVAEGSLPNDIYEIFYRPPHIT